MIELFLNYLLQLASITLQCFAVAMFALLLAGLFDSTKAYVKLKRGKWFSDNRWIMSNIYDPALKFYTYKQLRHDFMSHHFKLWGVIPLPWYIWCHLLGLIICTAFYLFTGYWMVYISYILVIYFEDRNYYRFKDFYLFFIFEEDTEGLPSGLPWLYNDLISIFPFMKPFALKIFGSEKVLKKDFQKLLSKSWKLSLITTFILTFLYKLFAVN